MTSVKNFSINKKNKKGKYENGQVWVETVIYTLIGLVLIGTVLAFATPAIMEQKDKATIEKTAVALQEMDNAIVEVKNFGTGNTRIINFILGEGNLLVDGKEEKIIFYIAEDEEDKIVGMCSLSLAFSTFNEGGAMGVFEDFFIVCACDFYFVSVCCFLNRDLAGNCGKWSDNFGCTRLK